MSEMSGEVALASVKAQIVACATTFCGATPGGSVFEAVVKECALMAKRRFGQMGLHEIKLAFELAASQRTSANATAYRGVFSIEMFGAIMSAYKAYRSPVVAGIFNANDALSAEQRANRKAERLAEWKAWVIEQFNSLKEFGAPEGAEWEKIPGNWAEHLVASGLLEGKDPALWALAAWVEKTQFCRAVYSRNVAGWPLELKSPDSARRVARAIEKDDDFFPAELDFKRRKTYGRLLVARAIGGALGDQVDRLAENMLDSIAAKARASANEGPPPETDSL